MLMAAMGFARPINDGNKLYASGDYAGALEKYMKAREAEPANPMLFYNIGTCQYKLGNFEEAIVLSIKDGSDRFHYQILDQD